MRFCIYLVVSILIISPISSAYGESDFNSLLPTWRLLSRQQKEQFVAGYLQGMREAEHITKLAIAGANEKNLSETLSQLPSVYDVQGLAARDLVVEIDAFYKKPENRDKPMFAAVIEARRSRR